MADKRHRTLLRTPVQALALIGIQAADVRDIVITHMHNDHAGTFDAWPNARFHLQDAEMDYATGRHMACAVHSRAYEPDHVAGLIRLDRKSVVCGTSVSVHVDLGGRRIMYKKRKHPKKAQQQRK